MPIDTEHRLVVIAIPESMVGRAFKQADRRRLHDIWGVGGKDVLTGKPVLFPDAEYRFRADHRRGVVAPHQALNRFRVK